MSRLTFEQIRIPAALILIIVVAFTFLPRAGADEPTATGAAPSAGTSATAGQPGGALVATPLPTPIPTATVAPTATPKPSPEPAAARVAGGFEAEVLACRSISGSSCNGELGTLPTGAGAFTALVRFTDAAAGDTIGVVLAGPGGTIVGGPYTLQGSGDGYYYSQFSVAGLPTGEYILTVTRNGAEVAQTSFRRGG